MITLNNNTIEISGELLNVEMVKNLTDTALSIAIEFGHLTWDEVQSFDIKKAVFTYDDNKAYDTICTYAELTGWTDRVVGIYIDEDGHFFKDLKERFKYGRGLDDLEVFEIFASRFDNDLTSVNFGFSGLMDILNRQSTYLDSKEKAIKKELTSGMNGWFFVNRVKDFDLISFKKYRSILLAAARKSHREWLKFRPGPVTLEDKAKKAQLTIDRFSCVCDADMLDQEYKTIKAYERKK